MSPRTRRRFLQASGLALGALVSGCTSSTPATEESTTSTDTATATQTATPTETSEFPPPEPTSAAPQDPTPMPTETDWPRFQFDAGNTGYRPDLTAVPDDPDTYWQFFVQSSPPVVADGSLYTAEYGRKRSVVARDGATGRIQWRTTIERGGGLGTPTIAGDTLVVQSFGLLFGLDRSSGDLRWSLDIGRGEPGSPVVVDGVAYLANGSYTEWTSAAFAVDVATGEEQWRVELGNTESNLRGSVAVADERMFVVDGDLVALDTQDGSEVWRTEFGTPAETTPTVANGAVYVTDTGGTLYALAVDDGTEQWTVQLDEPGRGTAAAVVDEEVYVGTDAALHALTTGGERRWQVSLSQATSPVADTEAVYVGERGYESSNVFAFDRETGDERWRHYTNEKAISDYVQSGLRGPPTLVEGGLYAVAADGIHALGR